MLKKLLPILLSGCMIAATISPVYAVDKTPADIGSDAAVESAEAADGDIAETDPAPEYSKEAEVLFSDTVVGGILDANQSPKIIVTLDQDVFTYTGKKICPVPSVSVQYDADYVVALKEGQDYEISYENNINPGTGYVEVDVYVDETDEYEEVADIVSKPFTITKMQLSDATLKYSSMAYTGKALTQTDTTVVTAIVNGQEKVLKNGTDYKVSYKNNVEVGTATMTITGKGNYSGTIEKTFEITPLSISDATITLKKKTVVYTGKALKPAVSVEYNGKTLVKGTDYTLKYSDNVEAGKGTITIKGKGHYSGTVTKKFTIREPDIRDAKVVLSQSKYTYDGKAKRPAVKSVTIGEKTLKQGRDFTVSYKNNKNAGKASVIIKGKGNYSGKITKTFTIKGINLKNAVITLEDHEYYDDGKEKKPKVLSVVLKGKTLKEGRDYTVSYKNNSAPENAHYGIYPTVIVTGKGGYVGTAEKRFAIYITFEETWVTTEESMQAAFDKYMDAVKYGYDTVDDFIRGIEGSIQTYIYFGGFTEETAKPYYKKMNKMAKEMQAKLDSGEWPLQEE